MTTRPKHNDQTLQIRIPKELHDQLKVVAEAMYMPISVMVRLALAEHVRTHATSALSRVVAHQDTKPKSSTPAKSPYDNWTPEQQKEYDDVWGA